MKKGQYEEPILNILCFECEDVVRTSDNWTEPIPTEYDFGQVLSEIINVKTGKAVKTYE